MSLSEQPRSRPLKPTSTAAQRASQQERVRLLKEQMAGVSVGKNASTKPHTGLSGAEPSGAGLSDDWVSSGCSALDRRLAEGQGFRRGSLVEWFETGLGSGAGTLALLVARQACARKGTLVVVDAAGQFYPPAAAACGLDLQRLVVIRFRGSCDSRDVLWAWDQALRCPAVKAVWGRLEALDDRWFRRFQLAAEQSGCLGLLLRHAKYRGDPSWSEVQLAVRAERERSQEREEEALEPPRASEGFNEPPIESSFEYQRRLRVELVRCRRARSASWMLGGEHAVVDLKLEEHHGQLQMVEASSALSQLKSG